MSLAANGSVILKMTDVHASYGSGPAVLRGVSVSLASGQFALLIGPNGAGKSTILRTVSGMTNLLNGSIEFDGESISKHSPEAVAKIGVAHVLQGRTAIPFLTAEENLRLGGYGLRSKELDSKVDRVLDALPTLRDFLERKAGQLSGGQQQLVELGRALVSQPRLLMIDEPSLGLAPSAASDVLNMVRNIADSGVTVLMVEQRVKDAYKLSDVVVVLRQGRVAMGPIRSAEVDFEAVRGVYMGEAIEPLEQR